ncbi:MAG: hypothetical protein ACKOCE_04550 [Acidimicrobiia bacterium]
MGVGSKVFEQQIALDDVEIRVGEARAVVDPRTRAVEPPSRRLGSGEYGRDQVLDIACNLARGG